MDQYERLTVQFSGFQIASSRAPFSSNNSATCLLLLVEPPSSQICPTAVESAVCPSGRLTFGSAPFSTNSLIVLICRFLAAQNKGVAPSESNVCNFAHAVVCAARSEVEAIEIGKDAVHTPSLGCR